MFKNQQKQSTLQKCQSEADVRLLLWYHLSFPYITSNEDVEEKKKTNVFLSEISDAMILN